jgi:RHS repeat-associated protein
MQVWSEDTSGSGKFLFQDHLGSTRITADASGNLKDDIDYLPFGEIEANYGTPSDIHYQFTGYESDMAEDSTAYATSRNLSVSMARFQRPDPYDGSYDLTNPQSLNRYTYAMNRPLVYVDPSGLQVTITNSDGSTYTYSDDQWAQLMANVSRAE